jgi:DNA-binding NarL/FixJ family response regulator
VFPCIAGVARIVSNLRALLPLAQPHQQAALAPVRVLIGLASPFDCQLFQAAVQNSRQRFDVVASAMSKHSILNCFLRKNVDVALISVDLEEGHLAGLDVLPELHTTDCRIPIVMLFDKWQDDLIVHAFRAGARGVFCRLERDLEKLWKCINAVHDGQVWANSGQMQLLLNALTKDAVVPPVVSPGLKSLAAREMQVAKLVTEGLPNKDIAVKLGLSEHTVSNYLFRIYNKLGISRRIELALYILQDREPSDVVHERPARTRTLDVIACMGS